MTSTIGPCRAVTSGTAPGMADWQIVIERNVEERLDRVREVMSRL
jgi:hypothetical protein